MVAGMAHKGTSVVLYRWPELRQHQYTAITDWTGGLYISPGANPQGCFHCVDVLKMHIQDSPCQS